MIAVLLSSCLWASGNLILDSCSYESDSIAQSNWQAFDGGLAVKANNKGIRLPFNLRGDHARAYWDRKLNVDLSRVDRLSFDFFVSDTRQVSATFNCYFQCPGGWYTANFPAENGWNHISLSKSSFHTEESPTGWGHITTMRVGAWKSVDGEGEMGIANIEALSSDVAVIYGDKTKPTSAEFGTVETQTKTVTKVLEDAGIPCGGLTDTDVESGALAGRRIAIFPHNPDMTDKEMDEVEKFVKAGGKVIGFYSVNPRLLRLIGVQVVGWKRGDSGFLSSIRFSGAEFEGIPTFVNQASWNTNVVQPIRNDAKVIGEWRTSANVSTGIPAWIASQNGAYMSHVLLSDDPVKKGQMMLSILGHYDKDLWIAACNKAKASATQVGSFSTLAEARTSLGEAAINPVESLLKQASKAEVNEDSVTAIKLYGQAKDALVKAYCASQPSKPNEMRAVWCHSAFGISGQTWDTALSSLAANGMNAIFPNMLWGGRAYYASKLLPVDESVATQGDQITKCLEAAHKHNIKVNVWKVNWNLINAPAEFLASMRTQKRTQKDPSGKDLDWLCPSNPLNFQLEHDSMLEVVTNYDVDGIHFDYIRYPGSEGCYCDGCRTRFEESVEVRVKNWPWDVINGPLKTKYQEFRSSNITRLVRAVSRDARKIRPSIRLSAAVFPDWPMCRDTVGQDWATWVKEGTLDWVCPMDYTASATQYDQWMSTQSGALNKPLAFRPGIGATLDSAMTPDQIVRQIQLGRSHGSTGFILFNFEEGMLKNVLPYLHLGVTKK